MTKETRKALRIAIKDQLTSMTSEQSNQDSIVQIAGHTISRRYVYAGCSQWSGCDWDETQSAWAWVVDEQYLLTFPSLGGFDGHNMIDKQSEYYLQGDFSETPPSGPEGDPMTEVPVRILIEIGTGIHCAAEAAKRQAAIEESEAARLIAVFAPVAEIDKDAMVTA